MPHIAATTVFAFLFVAVATTRGRAQFGATAEVERPLAASNPVDPTSSGTVVELGDRVATGETVQDVLPEVPGLTVQPLGGEGAFVGVSLRGADVSRTDVYIDRIPIGSVDAGAFDFSLLPIESFEQIQVYRGGAPLVFGSTAIGGLARFMPNLSLPSQVSLKGRAGSFETWEVLAKGAASTERLRLFASTRVFRTRGNFRFVNDDARSFEDADFVDRRRNNDNETADGVIFADVATDAGNLQLLFVGTGRQRGEAGPSTTGAGNVRVKEHFLLGGLAWTHDRTTRRGKNFLLNVVASAGGRRFRVQDPLLELGNTIDDTDNRTFQAQGQLSLLYEPVDWLALTLLSRAAYERHDPDNATSPIGPPPRSHRVTLVHGAELRFHGTVRQTRWEVRPSAQLHFADVRANIAMPAVDSFTEMSALVPTFRVGLGVGPLDWLSFVASGFRGVRLPTAMELFGDQSVFLPSQDLRIEGSWGVDAGVVLRGRRAERVSGFFDIRGFAQWYDDFIRFSQTAQQQFFATNEPTARSSGIEVSSNAEFVGHLRFAGQFTWNRTRDDGGRSLPRAPIVRGYARVTVYGGPWSTLDELSLFFETRHRGVRFLDPANFIRDPARTWFGIGFRALVLNKTLSFAVTMRDVLDRGGRAFLAYPLPQQRLYASIEYRKEL